MEPSYTLRLPHAIRGAHAWDCIAPYAPRQGETVVVAGQDFKVSRVIHALDAEFVDQPDIQTTLVRMRTYVYLETIFAAARREEE